MTMNIKFQLKNIPTLCTNIKEEVINKFYIKLGILEKILLCEGNMKLSEKEFTMLINESINGRFVQCDFGVGFVRLQDISENKWAFDRIDEIRNPISI